MLYSIASHMPMSINYVPYQAALMSSFSPDDENCRSTAEMLAYASQWRRKAVKNSKRVPCKCQVRREMVSLDERILLSN